MAKRRQPKTKSQVPSSKSRVKKQPRSAALPGLEDHAIRPLDDAAAEYADIRDQRMELTRQESDLKSRTMKLMKKYGKAKYQHNGILIEVEPGEESLKVRVKKVEEDIDQAPEDAPDEAPAETLADA